jgi:protein-S-isoprenylcysteine O-methyltransferase Ste14
MKTQRASRVWAGRSAWAASDFEFRYRSLIFLAIYLLAFAFWPLDRRDVASVIGKLLPADSARTQLSYLLAALPAIFAAGLGTWAFAYLSAQASEGLRPGTSPLVTGGPYRFVRHPMYLGTILCLLGFAFLLNRLGFFMMVSGSMAFTYRLILREEAELATVYGERYRAYREAVPRLIPALRSASLPAGGAANWRDGLLGGTYLWLVAASLVVLAASLKESLFYATLVAALAVKLASLRWAKRLASFPAVPRPGASPR